MPLLHAAAPSTIARPSTARPTPSLRCSGASGSASSGRATERARPPAPRASRFQPPATTPEEAGSDSASSAAGRRVAVERLAGGRFLLAAVEPERPREDAGRRVDVVRAGMRRTVIASAARIRQAGARVPHRSRGPNVTDMTSASPTGSWPTPITSELVVRAAARLGEVVVDGDDVWWSESRPAEGGRSVIVRRSADGTVTDVLPGAVERPHPGARVRRRRVDGRRRHAVVHRVHRPAAVPAGRRQRRAGRGDAGARRAGRRPARRPPRRCPTGCSPSGRPTAEGDRPADVVNEIVRVVARRHAEVLVSGPDFVSDPRLAPDGVTLSWLQWDHPNMPWDAAQLVVRAADGTEHVARRRSRASPSSSRSGATDLALWWFSDRTDFWSLYRKRPHEAARARRRRRQRHRRAAVGVRAEPVRAARRRPGGVRLRPGRRRPARRPRGRTASVRELDVPFSAFR